MALGNAVGAGAAGPSASAAASFKTDASAAANVGGATFNFGNTPAGTQFTSPLSMTEILVISGAAIAVAFIAMHKRKS